VTSNSAFSLTGPTTLLVTGEAFCIIHTASSGRMSCNAVKKKIGGAFHSPSYPPPHTDTPHHSFLFHPPPSVTSPSAGAAATATAREAPARATPARGRRAAEGGGSPLPNGDATLSRRRATEGGAAPARPPLPCTRGESRRAGQGQAQRRGGLRHRGWRRASSRPRAPATAPPAASSSVCGGALGGRHPARSTAWTSSSSFDFCLPLSTSFLDVSMFDFACCKG
jgi:hypothetical protein